LDLLEQKRPISKVRTEFLQQLLSFEIQLKGRGSLLISEKQKQKVKRVNKKKQNKP
jgi:hypothetical protein